MLANGINPELVIVDGEIVRAWPLIERGIRTAVNARALGSNAEALKIRKTGITGNASLLGAISLIISRRFDLMGRTQAWLESAATIRKVLSA